MNEKIVPDAEGLATPDKERGEEKGISPHTPFKEKEGQKETPPPPPEGSPLACARARLVAAVAEMRSSGKGLIVSADTLAEAHAFAAAAAKCLRTPPVTVRLHLGELTMRFDDPGKIAAFSDGGRGAAEIRRTAGREAEIAHALDRLSPADRDFVRTVLSGKGWRETGLGKRSFNKRLAAVCRRIGE